VLVRADAGTLLILPPVLRHERGCFDPLGALLLGTGIAGLTLGLSFGEEWGWTSQRLVLVLGGSLAALIAAILVERVVAHPILDVTLFHGRVFASELGSLILMMLAVFAVNFLLPFYFEELRSLSSAESGLLLTPQPLAIAAVAPMAGALADRFGSRWLSPFGLAITTLGLILLAGIDATSSLADVAWPLVVAGIGQGLFFSPNTNTLMSVVPPARQGEASGLLITGRVVGQGLSVAIAGAIFTSLGAADAGAALATQRDTMPAYQLHAVQRIFVHGFQMALLVCAAFAAAGFLLALVRGKNR
jgi:MFS family permease